jgi:hypothetical protein
MHISVIDLKTNTSSDNKSTAYFYFSFYFKHLWSFAVAFGESNGAQERTRTSTSFRKPAPEAGASTSSATWAGKQGGRHTLSPAGLSIEQSGEVQISRTKTVERNQPFLADTASTMALASSAPRRTCTRSPGSDQAGRRESEARMTAE